MASPEDLQKLYIAYFGRPADPAGLQFYSPKSVNDVLSSFAASTESEVLYASSSTQQLVNAIYSFLFNRPAEAAGLAYWTNQINSGQLTSAQAAYQILSSAGPGDSTAIANKVAAANAFTDDLDTNAEIVGYSGANATAVARAYLATIDSTDYSIANLSSKAAQAVADATGISTTPPVVVPVDPVVPGPTFNAAVTAGAVSFSGTATGDITVAWSGGVGASDATFSKGGVTSIATFGTSPAASSITLSATDTLTGSASMLPLTEN